MQSAYFLRSFRQAAWAVLIAGVGIGLGFWVSEPGTQAFVIPMCWPFFYALVFSIAFRRKMIVAISPAVVIHFLIIAYYIAFLSMQASMVVMPLSMIVAGLVPGAFIVIGILAGFHRLRFFRVICYIFYICCFCIVMLGQWSIEDFQELFRSAGFSMELFIYAFLAGGAFMLFAGNLVQLFLLIPPPERASTGVIHEMIVGPVTYHKEQSDLMADNVGKNPLDSIALLLILAQSALLAANAFIGFASSGILANALVVFVYIVVIPWEKGRAEHRIVSTSLLGTET